MDLFYVGTKDACNQIRRALDEVFGYPQPGVTNGAPIVNGETCRCMRAAWLALTQEQRDSEAFDRLYSGWSVRYSRLVVEPDPGTRFGVWVPSNIQEALTEGRELPLQDVSTLLEAAASASEAMPNDWIEVA